MGDRAAVNTRGRYHHCGLPGHDRDKEDGPKHCTYTKQQRPLFAYAISPKRYALCLREGNRWRVVSYKESALGALMNPKEVKGGKGWIADRWDAIANEDSCPFADVPAVRKYSITSWDVYKRVQKLSLGKSYQARVKPFNFAMTVTEDGLSRPPGREAVALPAPYEPDPRCWLKMDWIDYHTGKVYRIRTDFDPQNRDQWVRTVRSFGTLYEEYRTHPSPECLGPDGLVCGEETMGMLSPRPVRMSELHYTGKQTNEIERVDAGFVDEQDEMLLDFTEARDWFSRIQPVLRDMPLSVLCRELPGTPSRTIRSWRNGECHPGSGERFALERVCPPAPGTRCGPWASRYLITTSPPY